MVDRVAIGQEILLEAMTGHIESTSTVEGISSMLIELDASPDEVGNAISALADIRDDGSIDRPVYRAAVLDGFLIALKAVRIAEERQRGGS